MLETIPLAIGIELAVRNALISMGCQATVKKGLALIGERLTLGKLDPNHDIQRAAHLAQLNASAHLLEKALATLPEGGTAADERPHYLRALASLKETANRIGNANASELATFLPKGGYDVIEAGLRNLLAAEKHQPLATTEPLVAATLQLVAIAGEWKTGEVPEPISSLFRTPETGFHAAFSASIGALIREKDALFRIWLVLHQQSTNDTLEEVLRRLEDLTAHAAQRDSVALLIAGNEKRLDEMERSLARFERKLDAQGAKIDRLLDITVFGNDLPLARYIDLSDEQIAILPTRMVVAEHRIVPYCDFTGLARQMLDWGRKGKAVLGRLVIGGAGSGKTRLALHVADTLANEGWDYSGFLSRADLAHPDAQKRLRMRIVDSNTRGVFIVIDYAEARIRNIREILNIAKALQSDPKAKPVRILLLARTAGAGTGDAWSHSKGDWWNTLMDPRGADTSFARQVFEVKPFVAETANSVPNDQRKTFVLSAASSFEAKLRTAGRDDLIAPEDARKPIPQSRLESAHCANPLLLCLEAFLHVRGERRGGSAVTEMLRDEAKHWLRALEKKLGRQPALLENTMRGSVALATMIQGVSETDAADVVRLAGRTVLAGVSSEIAADARSAVHEALVRLYGDHGRIRPLRPDLLGEHLIGEALGTAPDLIAQALDNFGSEAETILTIVNRATASPHDEANLLPCLTAALKAALPTRFESIAGPLVAASQLSAGKLPEIARNVLGSLELQMRERAGRALSDATVLANPNATSARLIGLLADAAAADASDTDTTNIRDLDYAERLDHRSSALARAGHLKEALAASKEALDLYGSLALAGNERPSLLARILINYSSRLSDLGEHQEAIARGGMAVLVYRQMFARTPGTITAEYPMAVTNFGNLLAKLGRHQHALEVTQEAITYYEAFRDKGEALTQFYASTVNNLGTHLANCGRDDEAITAFRKAVGLRRALVGQNADAYSSDLAISLNNLANALLKKGMFEEALPPTEEALGLVRQLASIEVDAYLPLLATLLRDLSIRLCRLGRRGEEAIAAIGEAADIRQRLVDKYGATRRLDLAHALQDKSIVLATFGHVLKSAFPASKAHQLYAELSAKDDSYRPDMANCCRIQAEALMLQKDQKQAAVLFLTALSHLRGTITTAEQFENALHLVSRYVTAAEASGISDKEIGMQLRAAGFEPMP